MHLARKLFGEILPFRIDHRRGHVTVKGGLAHGEEFFEAESVTLHPTDDGRLQARLSYSGEIPEALHSPQEGSAIWFHLDQDWNSASPFPTASFTNSNVKVLSAPDFFLNDAGGQSPIRPSTKRPHFSSIISLRLPMPVGGPLTSTLRVPLAILGQRLT